MPFIGAVSDPSSAWVGQSKGVPVSRAVLDRKTLQPLKIGTMIVVSQEWIDSSDPRTERMVLSMMLRSARLTADAAIANPSNTGSTNVTPAAVTSAATPIASTDDIANDADAAIAAYGGSLETAVWWMHPRLAARLACVPVLAIYGADLGVKGGSLGGIPRLHQRRCSRWRPDPDRPRQRGTV